MYSSLAVVIDASNVAWEAALGGREKASNRVRPPLRGLVQAVNYFEQYRTREATVLAVAPAWWDRDSNMETQDENAYVALKDAGILVLAPPNTHDDLFVLGCAIRDESVAIVTNDLFRDHQEKLGLSRVWYEARRLGFEFIHDQFAPNERKLREILQGVGLHNEENPVVFDLPELWDSATPHPTDESAPRAFEETLYVPVERLGWMIGKGGHRHKSIQNRFGAHINIGQQGKITISALTHERVTWARIEFCSIPTEPRQFRVPQNDRMDVVHEHHSLNRVAPLDISASAFVVQPNPEIRPLSARVDVVQHPPTNVQQSTQSSTNIAPLDAVFSPVPRPRPKPEESKPPRITASSGGANLAPLDTGMSQTGRVPPSTSHQGGPTNARVHSTIASLDVPSQNHN